MGYSFKLDEDIPAGFVRIGLEQIDRAMRELTDTADPVVSVHATRKSLKRLRALLRLGRPGLGEAVYQRENARFRDIAQRMAGNRDRAVMLETADKLSWRQGHRIKAALAALRERIAGEAEAGTEADPAGLPVLAGELQAARKAFRKLRLRPGGFSALALGLEQCYRAGRRALRRAYEAADDEAFHEWRKGTQQHWRHMALLAKAWPDLAAVRLAEARELSLILGEDHDLSLLAARAGTCLPPGQARLVEKLCRTRQALLRQRARPRGERLFAEKPRVLAGRFELYWRLAREIKASGDAGDAPDGGPETDAVPEGARAVPPGTAPSG